MLYLSALAVVVAVASVGGIVAAEWSRRRRLDREELRTARDIRATDDDT